MPNIVWSHLYQIIYTFVPVSIDHSEMSGKMLSKCAVVTHSALSQNEHASSLNVEDKAKSLQSL